jgi:hypothetical protein
MRCFPAAILILSLLVHASGADVRSVVATLMNQEQELKGVLFSEVVHAATGRNVLPLDLTNAIDRELIGKISRALDEVLRKLNAPDGPAQKKRRINEVSSLFETAMKAELNAVAGFQCDFPRLASGAYQRSGYPDLRLTDKKSGRVIYLDPKLFERGSRTSSLRTFYYEPKRETNKILDDAHHLTVGFEHDGEEGAWKFLSWDLVDLAAFRVKLKVEFQASNRELYRPETIVARSRMNSTAETQRP